MRNIHKVPRKRWRKWSVLAKGVFNQHYSELRDGQGHIAPGTEAMATRNWRVLAWNAAWLAADAVDETLDAIAEGTMS